MKRERGFTLIELLILLGIIAFLISMVTINLGRAQQSTSLAAAVDVLTTDLRSQQLKAMVGDTSGSGSTANYGIYLSTNAYILFRGTYSAGNSANVVIDLPENTQIVSSTFPNAQAIFLKGSGETTTGATNTITLQDPDDTTRQETITVNRYGVVE